jgi:hypothetical protein
MAAQTKPAADMKPEPNLDDWDGTLRRAIKGSHEDVLAERERLRKQGVIDEPGNLLKKPSAPKGKSGDFGGWG